MITADRKTNDKLQFLVDNHSSLTRQEMADRLQESPRWVKRQIHTLILAGRIQPKTRMPERLLTDADWNNEVRNRVHELRTRYLKSSNYIRKILEHEFGLKMTRSTFQFWVKKLGLPGKRTQENWLQEYLPKNVAEELLSKGLRIVDIQSYLKDEYDVKISDDIILVHIKKLGLLSQKLRYFKSFEDRARNLSREWIEDKLLDRAGMITLVKSSGLSKRVLKNRLREENLSFLPRRTVWSINMERLRDELLALEPIQSDRIHEMLLGWLLGDGHLDSSGRFTINHSAKQLGYFYVKVKLLRKLITNIYTIPRQEQNSEILNAKEQFGLEMYGMDRYLQYLNPDGSKNYEKILSEMTPLAFACYYMDDGSWFGKSVMCMHRDMANRVLNRYWFGDLYKGYPTVKEINPEFILPCMAYKFPSTTTVGSFWKTLVPECFAPSFHKDLDICLLNSYNARNGEYIGELVTYYHKRGFPYYRVSDDYLKKQWNDLKLFETKKLWKDNVLRHTTIGNIIFEHFMEHMVEARHGSYSPLEIFKSSFMLNKSIGFLLEKRLPAIPDFLYKNILYSNKKVTGFSCAIAKALVEKFSLGDTIVDPCAGWGGRMLGVLALGKKYYGFEPWDKTSSKLKEMANFLGVGENAFIFSNAFSPDMAPSRCDCILTSPPYVDLETYGSTMTLPQWDALIASIMDYADRALMSNGRLILNIPSTLFYRLPTKDSLIRQSDVYWCSSAKQRKPTEVLFIWKKQISFRRTHGC